MGPPRRFRLAPLARAFYDTYGLDLGDVLGHHRPTLQGYRYSVRTLLPRVAYAETLLYRKRLPPTHPARPSTTSTGRSPPSPRPTAGTPAAVTWGRNGKGPHKSPHRDLRPLHSLRPNLLK